jgi:drug/metabolite transporter (DMT)-like permease
MLSLDLLLAVIIVSWGIWAFAEKKALHYGSPWQTLFASLLIKTVIALPILAFFLRTRGGPAGFAIGGRVWFWMLVALITNGVAIVILRFIFQKGGMGKAIALAETYPIVTTLLALVFLGETVTLQQSLGILVTIGGIYLISRQ